MMEDLHNFTYKSKYGDYEGCTFQVGRYVFTNNLAISVFSSKEGCMATLTVNTDKVLSDDMIAIKDYSENEGTVSWLLSEGIIEKEVEKIKSGWVTIPIYTLTDKGKELAKEVQE